jgi:hypothetical protein
VPGKSPSAPDAVSGASPPEVIDAAWRDGKGAASLVTYDRIFGIDKRCPIDNYW